MPNPVMMTRPLKVFAILLLAAVVSGCAFKPKTPEQQAKNSISYASEAAHKSDSKSVQINIDYVTILPGEAWQIAKFFQDNPNAARLYIAGAAQYIDSISYPSGVITERDSLSVLRSVNALPSAELDSLEVLLVQRAMRGNLDNTIQFELGDNVAGLGLLESPRHADIILNRTLKNASAPDAKGSKQIANIMAYAAAPSTSAASKRKIESSLGSLRITRKGLGYVRDVYPDFVNKWEASSTVKAMLVYSGGDKLAEADLMDTLKGHIKGVIWQAEPGRDVAVIKVDRLRYNEREDQQRKETVRYSDLDVDFAYRAFFMPRNASYLYEITASPVSIEYGYEVSVSASGKNEYSEIVRGNLAAANSKCSGARVENAFGGSSPVEFWANGDMHARCSSGAEKSIGDLRKDIEAHVLAAILKAPTISNVHAINQ